MQNIPTLHIAAHCEGPFKSSLYDRLFKEIERHDNHLFQIYNDDCDMQIQELMYRTAVMTTVKLNITCKDDLCSTLSLLIYAALADLDGTRYNTFADKLLIFISPTEDNDKLYRFQWSFIN